MKELIKEAVQAGWNDRLFYYYQQVSDANAIRPQDENGQEWKSIIAFLELYSKAEDIKPVPTPKVETNDQTGSIRD